MDEERKTHWTAEEIAQIAADEGIVIELTSKQDRDEEFTTLTTRRCWKSSIRHSKTRNPPINCRPLIIKLRHLIGPSRVTS
jgi:hypothetical protein